MKEKIYYGNLENDLKKVNDISKRNYKEYLLMGILPYLLTYGYTLIGSIFTTGNVKIYFQVVFIILKEPLVLILISGVSLGIILRMEYKFQERKNKYIKTINKINNIKEELNIKDIELMKKETLPLKHSSKEFEKQIFNVTTINNKKEYLLAIKDYVNKIYLSENEKDREIIKEYKFLK